MSTPHILIVDDDPKIRSGLAKFLGQQGLRVSVASDGKQFREKLATSKLDLIVLDVMLPDENGLSFLRQTQAANPRSSNLTRQLLGEPRPTMSFASAVFGRRSRPSLLIPTRAPRNSGGGSGLSFAFFMRAWLRLAP